MSLCFQRLICIFRTSSIVHIYESGWQNIVWHGYSQSWYFPCCMRLFPDVGEQNGGVALPGWFELTSVTWVLYLFLWFFDALISSRFLFIIQYISCDTYMFLIMTSLAQQSLSLSLSPSLLSFCVNKLNISTTLLIQRYIIHMLLWWEGVNAC